MENITFYREWFPLDKKEFRLLAMIADLGEFKGNLTDMCRYLSLDPQTRNRNQLKASIQKLTKENFIEYSKTGNTYILKAIPKETEICIEREWLHRLKSHEYEAASVSWVSTLKVLLWLCEQNFDEIFTNAEVADDLKISVSTIGSAKNVLEKDFEAIVREIISEKITETCFHRIGQKVSVNAWWKDD